MEVLGRDPARGAYRVSAGGVTALLPEAMIAEDRPLTGGHGHGTAYDWIARNSTRIERALLSLREGRPVRAPFDRIVLEEEA